MNRIGDFLARFNLFIPVDTIVARTISDVIKEVVGVAVDPKKVTHKGGRVFVSEHAATRTAILLNQTKILESANTRLKPYSVTLLSVS